MPEPVSVVVAAHNEAAVIGRCLDALAAQQGLGAPLDVTVAPNGCVDATAEIARGRGVRVVEVDRALKTAALDAGDAVAVGFPRIYLDADIVAPPTAVAALVAALGDASPALAAVPRRRLDVAGRPLLLRAYFAISSRHPAYDDGLFGRGMIALSARGRARFDTFPDLVADDLFLDSLFTGTEKVVVQDTEVVVATPFRTRDLLNRLVRVRRGNAALRAADSRAVPGGTVRGEVRPSDRWAWLRVVVLPRPWLAPAAVVYVALTLLAAARARLAPPPGGAWGRDESTRRPTADEPGPSGVAA